MTTPDPRAIAAGLSDDEKHALLSISDYKDFEEVTTAISQHGGKLFSLGLVDHGSWMRHSILTPLGGAVRSALKEQNNG